MSNDLDSINSGQLLTFLFATEVGIGILVLPRTLIKEVGTGGWISIILAAFLVGIGVICITLLNRMIGDSGFAALPILLGKPLGWVFSVALMLYLVAISSIVLNLFVEVVRIWFFPAASRLTLMLFLLVPSVYMVSKGLRVVALFDGFIYLIMALLALVPLHGIIDGNILFLRPVLQVTIGKLTSGALKSGVSFLGFELLLFFYPEVLGKKRLFLTGAGSIAMATFFYVGAFIAAIALFGPVQPAHLTYPLLEISRTISLPIVERVDLLFGGLWVTAITTTISGFLIGLVKAVETRFHVRNRISLAVISIVTVIASLITGSFAEAEALADMIGIVGLAVGVVFPAVLLPVAWLRKGAIKKWHQSK